MLGLSLLYFYFCQSVNLCLLTGIFCPFTFSVMTDILPVLSLCVLPCLFLYNFLLSFQLRESGKEWDKQFSASQLYIFASLF